MEQEIINLKKAMFINWAWAYNPALLSEEDLSWFYENYLKENINERQKNEVGKPEPIITTNEPDGTTKIVTNHIESTQG